MTQNTQLRLTLEAQQRTRQGAPVPLVFTVANAGRISITLQLLGRTPTADFRIFDSRGRRVWSLLRGQTLLGVLRLFPIEPGKHLSFRHVWNQRTDEGSPVAPGEYLIRGVLLADDPKGFVSPPARLSIEP